MLVDWNKDGCPNNCGYCRQHHFPCVYSKEGKERPYRCELCGKAIANDERYSYRDHDFCDDCLDAGICLTEIKRRHGDAFERVYEEMFDRFQQARCAHQIPEMAKIYHHMIATALRIIERHDFMIPNIEGFLLRHPLSISMMQQIKDHLSKEEVQDLTRWKQAVQLFHAGERR